jgi:hypothetical protein
LRGRQSELAEDQTVYSNAKAKRLLGFAPKHDWTPQS